MAMLVDLISWVFLVVGGLFGVIAAIGMLRFPDFYTRLHASSLNETLGAGLILTGLALQAGWSLIAVKLLFILIFIFFTGPTASHALAKAALHGRLKPMLSGGAVSNR